MEQTLVENHQKDLEGRPAGGTTTGMGISIAWQDGPLGRGEERQKPNGAFVEGVIQAAIGRLRFYQGTEFQCRENAIAITKLEEGLLWCQARTQRRERAGVEGTYAGT